MTMNSSHFTDETPEGRRRARVVGSLGGLTFAARNNVSVSAAAARAAQAAKYANGHSCSLCPTAIIPDSLPLPERERRAGALRKLHMKRLALKRHGL